jgi:hypothetical protein
LPPLNIPIPTSTVHPATNKNMTPPMMSSTNPAWLFLGGGGGGGAAAPHFVPSK